MKYNFIRKYLETILFEMKSLIHYHENPDTLRSLEPTEYLSCIPRKNTTHYSSGEKDELGLREKEGCEEKKSDAVKEIYNGNFVYDNFHGNSVYEWITDRGLTAYEGFIFCNVIEGYGRFSYPDGSVFEGLFKDNHRYGPGVYTEPNGRQCVGFWMFKKIIKLATKVELGVPLLCPTRQGKIKLQRFKKILRIEQGFPDLARDILIEMDAPAYIMETADCLYNVHVIDTRCPTFYWRPYEDVQTRTATDTRITDVIQNILKTDPKYKLGKTKRKGKLNKWRDTVDVMDKKNMTMEELVKNATHLVTWNNSPLMQDMLLYCYKHSKQEGIVTYNIADIMKGKRETFRAPGVHETLCVRFLMKCQRGVSERVRDYIAFKNIDPNMSDSEGNTGLLIAVQHKSSLNTYSREDLKLEVFVCKANYQLTVIDTILDQGADINKCNDEGFTPLGLSVTQYFALINNVSEWQKAFLKNPVETTNPECTLRWRHPGKDPQSFTRYLDDDDKSLSEPEDIEPETGEKLFSSQPKEMQNTCKTAKETVLKLLKRGANPKMSYVPKPVLLLAIECFDEDIIRGILDTKCSEGVTKQDDPLLQDALFAAVQLPPNKAMISICKILLDHGANPNACIEGTKEDEKLFKICQLSKEERGKKTVLHALVTRDNAVRYNEYLCEAVQLLLNYKANSDAIFLGHTPLSAAIVKGNVGVVKCLMELQMDPNQKLAQELGVPLTVLMNPSCTQRLSFDNAINIIRILVSKGANLLTDIKVGSFTGNIIEFSYKESENIKRPSKKEQLEKQSTDYLALADYITKLAQQALINKVKSIICESSQPFVPNLEQASQPSATPTSRLSSLIKGKEQLNVPALPDLPSWISADDMVQILNYIQESDKVSISKEQAATVLQRILPSKSNSEDQQELERYLSLIKVYNESKMQDVKKYGRKSMRKSEARGQKRESRKSWNLLAALKRTRSVTSSKISTSSKPIIN